MVILIVEDSSTMRQLVCLALRRIDGAVLVEATDGANALTKLVDIKPDVIVTDLNMPVMNGIELIERVRAREDLRDVPIVVLTNEGALAEEGTLAVSTYVAKTHDANAIVAAVQHALERD